MASTSRASIPRDVLGEPGEQGQPGAQVGRAGALGQPGPGVDGPVREAAQAGLGDDVDGRLEQFHQAAATGAGRRHVTHCVAPGPMPEPKHRPRARWGDGVD